MPIELTCSCGVRLRAGDSAAGKTVPCPKCGATIAVPAPSAGGNTKICPACAESIRAEARICRFCSYSFDGPKCPDCASDNPPGFQMCQSCGAPLRTQARRTPPPEIKDYLVPAILSFLFCGGLLAVPAIIYSAHVRSKKAAGDYEGAMADSRSAKTWLTVAVSVGCGLVLLVVLLGLAAN